MLGVDSPDYTEWLVEAEERFGIAIPDGDAEAMGTVGDFLRYIRLHGKPKDSPGRHDPLWDRGLDG